MAKLTTKGRKRIKQSNFALPGQRRYPIHDKVLIRGSRDGGCRPGAWPTPRRAVPTLVESTCVLDGCERVAGVPGSARGMCRGHYRRWQRYGDAEEPPRRVYSWKGQVCAADSCEREIYGKGLCEKHAARKRRVTNPAAQRERMRRWKEKKEVSLVAAAGRPRADTCELCGIPGRTVWDHCHGSGEFRGWLCQRCNRVLGSINDNIDLLQAMIFYLERSRDGQG